MGKQDAIILCAGQYPAWMRAWRLKESGFNVQEVDIYADQSSAKKPRIRDYAQAATREWGSSLLSTLNGRLIVADFEGALLKADSLGIERFYLEAYGVGANYALLFLQDGKSRSRIAGAILYDPHFINLPIYSPDFEKLSPSTSLLIIFGSDDVQTADRAVALASNFRHINIEVKKFPGEYGFAHAFLRGNWLPMPNISYAPKSARMSWGYVGETLKRWSLSE